MSLLASVPGTVALRDAEFETLRALIHDVAGIALAPAKRTLLESRLQRRLRALGVTSFSAYLERLRDLGPSEMVEMINCVTTNKTDFYREPHHFRFLQQQVLPAIEQRASGARRLRIWSAGCSTGEEPYTIALAIADALGHRLSAWDVRILASDIDTKVLAHAASGTYTADRIATVPTHLREHYFAPSAHQPGGFDIDDRLRRLITFRRINFADGRWPINATFDVIFCRNVIIYFDRETQATLFDRFSRLLRRDGHLVIGHSETLNWLSSTFVQVRGVPTVYRLAGGGETVLRPPAGLVTDAPTDVEAATSPTAGAERGMPAPTEKSARMVGAPRLTTPRSSRRLVDQRLRHGATVSASHMPHTHAITVGGVFASREPAVVRTLLGSCVAACLYDPVTGVGGMNHFLLPEGPAHDVQETTRYGVHAMEVLINELMHHGADRRRLRAKAFGASDAIRHVVLSREVQRRNADFIREFLAVEGIVLEKALLGGPRPLEVLFATDSGKAFVRALTLPSTDTLATDEDRYSEALVHPRAAAEDDVTLF